MKPKFLDFIALAIALSVLIASTLAAFQNPQDAILLHIKTLQGEWYYPLETKREITVSGTIGETRIMIESGNAFVSSAPCREKLCIKQGKISKPGEWVACLPNSVLLSVEAQKNEEWDSVSY